MNKSLSAVFTAAILFFQFSILDCPAYAEWPKTPLPIEITTTPEDTEYLRGVMKDTLDSILYYRNPVTGFPSYIPENPNNQEIIKGEHIFLVFASIAIAGKTGLIPEQQAEKELLKMLDWIEKIPTADGFFMDMIHTADASAGPNKSYPTADYGFNPCGLIVAGEAYPKIRKRALKLANATRWDKIYNNSTGYIGGMLYIKPGGSIRADGSMLFLAMDMRMAIFLSIASGAAPAELWARMPRYYQERYGVRYLKPGEALGYGEQTWALGYFLDERGSEIGMSNANMAWGQICYAQDMDYPVWGWSNCLAPPGYMGFGDPNTNWSVVNAHAIAAAAPYYPNQVTKALRVLERMGCREPININGAKRRFGFRGAVNIDTKVSSGGIIPGLDQAIIFLSLANYLHDGIVWKYFQQNKTVRNGIALIPGYDNLKTEYLEIYKKRDNEGPVLPIEKSGAADSPVVVDAFKTDGEKNDLGGARGFLNSSAKIRRGTCSLNFALLNEKQCYFKESLAGTDLSRHKALKLTMRARKPGKVLTVIRISGEGGYRYLTLTSEWREFIIPLRSFLGGKDGFDYGNVNVVYKWTGMWHNRTRADELTFHPVNTANIEIKEISFLSLPKDKTDAVAAKIEDNSTILFDKKGTFDDMSATSEWRLLTAGPNAAARISITEGADGKCIACDYDFNSSGGWIALIRPAVFSIKDKRGFSFMVKNENSPGKGSYPNLDVKITDPGGSIFVHSFPGALSKTGWTTVEAPVDAFKYGWGGEKKDMIEKSTQFEFTIFSNGASRGRVYFDELRFN
ncbi:MAG: glucoamylase family protein [Elusimicrobiota bacterium]